MRCLKCVILLLKNRMVNKLFLRMRKKLILMLISVDSLARDVFFALYSVCVILISLLKMKKLFLKVKRTNNYV